MTTTGDAGNALDSEAGVVDASAITAELVHGLLVEQFPQWASLRLHPVADGGNDHRMFRLGDAMSVRLPSAPDYVPQVEKEQAWLPRLAPVLPLPIPEVRGSGRPTRAFPAPWSVYGWIAGARPTRAQIATDVRFAGDLAAFLVALRGADTAGAPAPGLHSAFRGGPVGHWDDEMRDLVLRVDGAERATARGMWRDALSAPFDGPAVWVHGDVAIANLLLRDGALGAVVDFGCSAVGDPACDTVMLWTQFVGEARDVFRAELQLDDATWARGRGWALWKGLIMITNKPPGQAEFARYVLDQLFAGV